MPKRVKPYSNALIRALMALTLMVAFSVSIPPESLGYKIEIGVAGPIGGHSVSEENGRTEIHLDTGPVMGPWGETGSAFATANLATGSLAPLPILPGARDLTGRLLFSLGHSIGYSYYPQSFEELLAARTRGRMVVDFALR